LGLSTIYLNYAVYGSSIPTSAVKSKLPDHLGLYDMSGNAWEFCFDLNGSERVRMGGACTSSNASRLQVGYRGGTIDPEWAEDGTVGFRFARRQ
jgi:formylglycine-generating enzyme required for sulfatase activity